MSFLADVVHYLSLAQHEVMLFAAVGLLIGGMDDLLLDLIFMARAWWRHNFVYDVHPRMRTVDLPPSADGEMAVFIPAWDESAVIGRMLERTLHSWRDQPFHLFVGVYPNDAATLSVVADVAAGSDRITMVVTDRPGPTTKADCLNALWRAMLRDEAARDGRLYRAVVLHDAEDVVHADEIRLFGALIDRFSLIQLPVLPLINQKSRWISGHYADEFAEAHTKILVVREALGAAMPSAGVGCAFSRGAMARIAAAQDGQPFQADCLTEDYELGLRIGESGGRGIFVRMRDVNDALVCTREFFPETLDTAVRQKARWMIGIALAGWDRLGWRGGPAEFWMRLRDRREALAALVLFAAYVGMMLFGLNDLICILSGLPRPGFSDVLTILLIINGILLLWRLGMRAALVTRAYGWREGVRSVPRSLVGNIIALLAARRAIGLYVRMIGGGAPRWEKTAHRFPDESQLGTQAR